VDDVAYNSAPPANVYRTYNGAMVVRSRALQNRWQAQISYVFAKTDGNVDNSGGQQIATRQFETPNLALVNAEGNLTYTPRHEFKLLGSYQIPRVEASVNAVLRATSGLYYTHIEQFPNSLLNALTAYRRIRIEPLGARQLPSLYQFDVRLEKSFRFPGTNRVDVYADIENLINRGGITDVITRSTSVALPDGTSFDLPFNTPGALQAPRQVRIGARWSF
jgi:hypothetical protein